MINIKEANTEFLNSNAEEIINFAIQNTCKQILTTNFGPYEAVILHMLIQVRPDIPIIWIDSGYNTRETYLVAKQLIDSMKLNIEVYTPKVTTMRNDCAHGGIPELDDARHEQFTDDFKLEPFKRAMSEQKADIWFTAVRSEQTEVRANMEVFSKGFNNMIKVAPLLNWKEQDMQDYLEKYNLKNVQNYFDPTKGLANRECGLHTKLD